MQSKTQEIENLLIKHNHNKSDESYKKLLNINRLPTILKIKSIKSI